MLEKNSSVICIRLINLERNFNLDMDIDAWSEEKKLAMFFKLHVEQLGFLGVINYLSWYLILI